MSDSVTSIGWSIFILFLCYCLPIVTCAIVICMCIRMPGCLLHNQELRLRSSDGSIITRAKKRVNNIRRQAPLPNEPSNYQQTANMYPEAAPVIIYKPTVSASPARHTPVHHPPTLRDMAEASNILKNNLPFEPPPPYNEAITMQTDTVSPSAPDIDNLNH